MDKRKADKLHQWEQQKEEERAGSNFKANPVVVGGEDWATIQAKKVGGGGGGSGGGGSIGGGDGGGGDGGGGGR